MNEAATRAKRIVDEVKGVKSMFGINDGDWQFLNDLVTRNPRALTEKQASYLGDLEQRVFG